MKIRKLSLAVAIGLCVLFTACKSRPSAYSQVYQAAQERSTINKPQSESTATAKAPAATDNDARQEKITAVDGANIKSYSVVVGSFVNKTNAASLKDRMIAKNYNAVLALNEKGMYRVIVATYDTYNEAAAVRDALRSDIPDAWILKQL
ncbi:MAG: SPOR domain-containing protein [Candidatus Symbiothrix sp.]|jgi:cell division protein FtsN|nr:SPOR domain-containing protein [Candidatus Symbiothrix sp.]